MSQNDSTSNDVSQAISGYKLPAGFLRMKTSVKEGLAAAVWKYAVVKLPESYEAAQVLAAKALGRWLRPNGGTIDPNNIHSEGITRNIDGEWRPTSIIPEDWAAIVPHCFPEILVHYRSCEGKASDEGSTEFLGGHLWLTVGWKKRGMIRWTPVSRHEHAEDTTTSGHRGGDPATPWVQRPASYEEALSLIQDAVLGDIGLANTFPWAASGRRAVALPKDNVTFYTFPSEEPWLGWKTFPLEAYSSVQKWKEVVPAPGHIIGVVLETPT